MTESGMWSPYGESGQAAIDAACESLRKLNRVLWYIIVGNVVLFNVLVILAVLRAV